MAMIFGFLGLGFGRLGTASGNRKSSASPSGRSFAETDYVPTLAL